jgi:hypothetical protein
MSLPLIGYFLACLVVAFGLTFLLSMLRSVKKTDDFKSWRWIIGFFVFVAVAPYVYADVMTRMHGGGMEKAVKAVLKAGEVNGKLSYYRVMKSGENEADIVIVADEKGTFGTPERATIQATLVKEKGEWRAKKFDFINSFKRGRDSATIPPFF